MNDFDKIIELSPDTVDKIAAGEVVERPASIVKELVENSIDADATAITVEIKDGGTTLIRVTDNGKGIDREQVPTAFLRHATSKIETADDLSHIHSLGFRGEALSSIAAIAKVEMITKRTQDITATDYCIEGAVPVSNDEIGAPDGTSIFVRQMFYNTPARRKFLKSPTTEGNYINEIVERLALSHPGVSFRFLNNGSQKLVTSGNNKLLDTIYEIYGKAIATSLIKIDVKNDIFTLSGFIGNPSVRRGNRAFESCFVGGRYVKSKLLQKAIEEGYEGYMMAHNYPFCVLNFIFEDETCDVNVHPTKQDVRFFNEQFVYEELVSAIKSALSNREDIADVQLAEEKKPVEIIKKEKGAEPFEVNRLRQMKADIAKSIREDSPYTPMYESFSRDNTSHAAEEKSSPSAAVPATDRTVRDMATFSDASVDKIQYVSEEKNNQLSFLSEEARKDHRIVGQVFNLYWIVEYDGSMYIIDQHAAHEKVLYERFMKDLAAKEMTSQQISPPAIVTLSLTEEMALKKFSDVFSELGFEVSHFGGKEYAIDAVPANLYNIDPKGLFSDIIAMCAEKNRPETDALIKERIASMSCKAAVKGNDHLSLLEAESLIDELLHLENPYHCPHGRPTIITLSRYELDKKFKRII